MASPRSSGAIVVTNMPLSERLPVIAANRVGPAPKAHRDLQHLAKRGAHGGERPRLGLDAARRRAIESIPPHVAAGLDVAVHEATARASASCGEFPTNLSVRVPPGIVQRTFG
jgi:hypothetical protein